METHKEIREREHRCQAVVGFKKAHCCGKKPVKREMYHGDPMYSFFGGGSTAVFVDLCRQHRNS